MDDGKVTQTRASRPVPERTCRAAAVAPEGRRGVATGGAKRNPWKRCTQTHSPRRGRRDVRVNRESPITNDPVAPPGRVQFFEHHPRVALRPPRRTSLHPWLHSDAPPGRTHRLAPYHSPVKRRRRFRKVIGLLVAGAVINVAVAWGLVRFVDMSDWIGTGFNDGWTTGLITPVDSNTQWQGYESRQRGRGRCVTLLTNMNQLPNLVNGSARSLPSYSTSNNVNVVEEKLVVPELRRSYFDDASGFPCLALVTHYAIHKESGGVVEFHGPEYGIEIQAKEIESDSGLPCRSVPSGPASPSTRCSTPRRCG